MHDAIGQQPEWIAQLLEAERAAIERAGLKSPAAQDSLNK